MRQQMEAAGIAYDAQPSARDRRIANLKERALHAATADPMQRSLSARSLPASSSSPQPLRPPSRSEARALRPLVGVGSDAELLNSFSSLRPPPLREEGQQRRS